MALKIIAATRIGGAGCQHYRLRVTDVAQGYDEIVGVHLDDLDDLIKNLHSEPSKRRAMFAAMWAMYRVRFSGATPASLVGVDIA